MDLHLPNGPIAITLWLFVKHRHGGAMALIEIDSAGLPNLKMAMVIFHGKLLNRCV